VPAPAAVVELGQRIGLSPQALASQLGDEHGDLSALTTDRLERGFNTAAALAKRLGLDEGRTQSVVTLVTNHVLNLLLEEKKAAPGSVDRARIDELTSTLVDDIRVTCGDAVATEAKSAVVGL
jgi:predicted O-methyltransferase YrrM